MHSELADLCTPQTAAMTPLQLMRAVIAALAKAATFAKGLVMARQQSLNADAGTILQPHAAAFRQHHSVVWVDPSGHLNLAAHVQPSTLAQVRVTCEGCKCRSCMLAGGSQTHHTALLRRALTELHKNRCGVRQSGHWRCWMRRTAQRAPLPPCSLRATHGRCCMTRCGASRCRCLRMRCPSAGTSPPGGQRVAKCQLRLPAA